MIRQLQQDSGAKIQVAQQPVPNKNIRYVFVEASEDKYMHAKSLIENIVSEHKKKVRQSKEHLERTNKDGNYTVVPIPDEVVRQMTRDSEQDVLRLVYDRTGAKVFIPKHVDHKTGNRMVEISGEK